MKIESRQKEETSKKNGKRAAHSRRAAELCLMTSLCNGVSRRVSGFTNLRLSILTRILRDRHDEEEESEAKRVKLDVPASM